MKHDIGQIIFWAIFAVGIIGVIMFYEYAWPDIVRMFAYRGEV
jgi:hypothetical protein